ncbi:hypothetical protein J1N35_021754 [Gossypium stocksii]|uniref:MULE transposase domain-containing protein n=1 Tax=Gossypium stocksii TaxID=47602 RepID=A0A9D3VFE8_9ROSI|nr:hypothetical protein J1N35_021754 [Gossypium stocksii]
MDNQFFVCVYFDGIILTTTVGCIFECQQQIEMRFNRNVSLDDMKGRINAKIVRRCGRRISKLFYKFPVSTDTIKFTETELVDDKDLETMIALYYGNESDKNAPIHLFAELASIEENKDLTAYGEEHKAQKLCMVAPISYVDSESTICGIDIDRNVTSDIDAIGEDGYDSSDLCDREVDSDSDLNLDDVLDDIDDKDVNDDGKINASLVGNRMRDIVIHNNPGPHMSFIDPDAAHVAEFLEYPEILLAHQLAVNSDLEELFVGQRFESKEECVFVIKWYSINISVDYKVTVSKLILYIGECWKLAEGCNWTWLYGKYTQTLLLAVAQDGNKNVLPIAFAILDKENLESWEFFLTNLQRLATLMPRMGQQQVNQMEGGHVFVEDVRIQWLQTVRWRGPMELISGTDGAIVGGLKHFIIHVRMSWQHVLK